MKGLNWVVALAATCGAWSAAQAEISGGVVRVGVLNDISASMPSSTCPTLRWA